MAIEIILKTVVAPAVLLAAVLAMIAPPWRGRPAPRRLLWVYGVALAVCFSGAAMVIFGQFDPWPLRGDRRIPHAGLLAAAAAIAVSLLRSSHRWLAWAAAAGCGAVGFGAVAYPVLAARQSTPVVALWLAGLGFGGLTLWVSARSLARTSVAPVSPAMLSMAALAASVTLLVASSASLAQLAGTLCALTAAMAVLALWNRSMSIADAAPVGAVILGAILTAGHFYTQGRMIPGATLMLAGVVPVAAVPSLIRPGNRSTTIGVGAGVLLALGAVGLALALADPVSDLGYSAARN